MKTLKVKGHPNLVRDMNSGAIININSSAINQAKIAKENKKKEKERIDNIEHDVNEIKTMLSQLMQLVSDKK